MGENSTSKWMKTHFHETCPSRGTVGLSTDLAAKDMRRKRKEQGPITDRGRLIKEDGERRSEIQLFIFKKVQQGCPPDQLLRRLNFIFGKPEYQPYKKYFKTWIMNVIEKQNNTPKKKEQDREEK